MTVNRWWLRDGVLAVLLAALGVVSTVFLDRNTGVDRPVDALALTLVAAAGLALTARRRLPVVTLAVVSVLTSTYLVLGYPYGPFLLSFVVAVYTVASRLPLTRSAPAALAALLVLVAHVFFHPGALPGYLGLIPGTGWAVVPFAVGVAVRQTRRAAERDRAEAVRERVYDERLRVAREVHDVVGHGLAAIKMQADIALHLLARKPEQATVALNAISRTSTEALAELRATLAVVRSAEPGLDALDDLRQRMCDAGVQVSLETTGPTPDLPAAVGHAGYRVVQESLTNVLRHSKSRVATVQVGYPAGAVRIAVSNPLPPGEASPAGPAGFGIAGMRDRVTALGGEFTAGPTPDGRFEVRARIPTGDRR
jgi:signal transduction histidine kinase